MSNNTTAVKLAERIQKIVEQRDKYRAIALAYRDLKRVEGKPIPESCIRGYERRKKIIEDWEKTY